jgi:hypothetical protein
VLDWPEPLGALVSLLLAGLFGVVMLVALVQTALSRRKDRWPWLTRRRNVNVQPDKIGDHQRHKDVERRRH